LLNGCEKEALMQERKKIAVAGATGRVGRPTVEVLEAAGHEVVPMSRSTGVDVVTGEGLSEALAGVDCIVDAASWPSNEQKPATDFFIAASRNLQEEGERAGVQRIVVVSIIGADRATTGYIASKVPHERAMQSGPIPVRILRAAQFHEFVPLFLEWGRQGDVIYVPQMRTQLVAARTVAEALAELATGSAPAPENSIPEIAGPREESLVEVAKLVAARRGDSVRIEAVSDPDDPEQALYASGGLLPGPHAVLAGPTFEQWFDSTT
jgi:uncharacterized protein YbjT (DUF2867 family)